MYAALLCAFNLRRRQNRQMLLLLLLLHPAVLSCHGLDVDVDRQHEWKVLGFDDA